MEKAHKEKIETTEFQLKELLEKKQTARNEQNWGLLAEFGDIERKLRQRLSILTNTTNSLEEIVYEIDLLIKNWIETYNEELDDKGAKSVNLELINDDIENLLVSYALETANEDTVFGVPITLCKNEGVGVVTFNESMYSSRNCIRTWIKHNVGVELSANVSISNTNAQLKELILKYWNSCLSKMSEFDYSRLEMIVLEIDMQIDNWLFEYNLETDDMGAKKEELDFYNNQIEELIAEYVVEKNYDDKLHGVPLSLCLNAPLGQVKFNKTKYSSSHILRTWIKHIGGVELSDQVSTSNVDRELKELALKYWNDCLSKMSEFE